MKKANNKNNSSKMSTPLLCIIWLKRLNSSDKEFENLIKYIDDMAEIAINNRCLVKSNAQNGGILNVFNSRRT